MKILIGFLLAGLVLAVCSVPSNATRVRRLTLTEIREKADAVVVGVVTAVSTRTDSDRKMVWTDYEINVEETLLGAEKDKRIMVSFAGGTDGDLSIGIVGIPRLQQGKRYVLCLFPQGTFASATVGWGQGIFFVVDTTIDSHSRTVLISYDHEPLEVDPTGKLLRGARVAVADGALRTLPTQRSDIEMSPRASEPVVYDAEGKQIPRAPVQREAPVARVTERRFATLDVHFVNPVPVDCEGNNV